MTNFQVAEALAADLAGAQVDVNEAQKALAYLRSKRQGKALFDYLQAVESNGQVVLRSGRTMRYYRDLLAISRRHLGGMQGRYEELVATYAWSLRLLRYFRAVRQEDQVRIYAPGAAALEPEPAPTPVTRAAPQLPETDAVFTGPVFAADETAVLVEVPGFDSEAVTGVITAENLAGRRYRVGNSARVKVLKVRKLKSGRTILDLRPARKDEEPTWRP